MNPRFSLAARHRAQYLGFSVWCAAMLATPLAHAATFGVHVTSPDGAPLSGVAVCVGMPGNYKQFGTGFTDGNGTVLLDVPDVPLVVTVSKNRFTGARLEQPARGFNLIRQVKLVEGVPGPHCSAGSSLVTAPEAESLRIDSIDVNIATDGVTLLPSVSGNPSHYRIGSSADLIGALWQPYEASISLDERQAESERLYVQTRRLTGRSDAWIETRSPIITLVLTHARPAS